VKEREIRLWKEDLKKSNSKIERANIIYLYHPTAQQPKKVL
jgi:hypothetical protein